jgi:hypothetical protein
MPDKLRRSVERRLTEHGFRDYKGLAEWIRLQGYKISMKSLRRYRTALTRKPKTARLTSSSGLRGRKVLAQSVTTEGLMQLTQEKLCSALVEINQLKRGDMSRLAHAVAHLTQASISLQRWTDQHSQRSEDQEQAISQGSSVPGGLSPETSLALRNALLGIAPFSPESGTSRKAQKGRVEPEVPQAARGQVKPTNGKPG